MTRASRIALRTLSRGSRRGLAVLVFAAFGNQTVVASSRDCEDTRTSDVAATDGAAMQLPTSPNHHGMGGDTMPDAPPAHDSDLDAVVGGCALCIVVPISGAAATGSLATAAIAVGPLVQQPRSRSEAPDVPPPRA